MAQKSQNRRKRKTFHLDKDLDILDDFRHDVSGARLIIARAQGDQTRFVVAWVAAWQKTIFTYNLRKDRREAEKIFRKLRKNPPPVTPSLQRDWQQNKVYAWEEAILDKRGTNLTTEQMERVVRRISKDFNIAAPDFGYKKPRSNQQTIGTYDTEEHQILMNYKKLNYLIHELAHAIDMKVNGNKWAGHGPGFVRTLIHLADKYQYWHCPDELEKEARKVGIQIASDKKAPKP